MFGIQNNNISDESADDIATVLSHNAQLQVLRLGENHLQTEGAIKIVKGLQLQGVNTLTLFDVNSNNISGETADEIAAVLFHNA